MRCINVDKVTSLVALVHITTPWLQMAFREGLGRKQQNTQFRSGCLEKITFVSILYKILVVVWSECGGSTRLVLGGKKPRALASLTSNHTLHHDLMGNAIIIDCILW